MENSLWKRLRTCRKTDYRMNEVGHLGAVFYRFTMPRLTNTQKQENYRKRKKEAEEGSQRPKKRSPTFNLSA
jgi:hypothetical protein